MLGLEVYTGAVDDFGFEDYLNGKCPLLQLQVSQCYIHFFRSVDTNLMVYQYALAANYLMKIHTLVSLMLARSNRSSLLQCLIFLKSSSC